MAHTYFGNLIFKVKAIAQIKQILGHLINLNLHTAFTHAAKMVVLTLSIATMGLLTGCPGATTSSSMIDQLLGGASQRPILTAVPAQTIQQLATVSIDVNNTKKSAPGTDEEMSYTCSWDRVVDGVVADAGVAGASSACNSLPGNLSEFNTGTGALRWIPSLNELGKFEVKIAGTNSHGTDERVFIIDVRLAFIGLESLTDVQGSQMTLHWTANPSASGYQIMKKNSDGTYAVYQTVVDPAAESVTLTGLTPLHTYAWRVNAIDSLAQTDGNTVSLSAVTADLIRLEVTADATQLSPGQSTLVTVRLKDNGGNYLNISGLTVGVALTNSTVGSSSGTFSAVNDLGTGVYTSTFTATAPGLLNPITASLTQFYFVEQTAAMTVEPLKIEILVSAATVNPGRAVLVTAKIRDYTGALISWGGHGLNFTYSGGGSTGTIGAVTDGGHGTYTATFTGGAAGTATTLGATISTTSQIYATTTVTVAPYQLEITSDHTDLSVTRTAVITARVKDWEGNYLNSGGQGVAFSILGAAGIATIGSVTDGGHGSYTATLSGLSLGTVVISGSMTPSYQITTSPTVVVRKLRLEITSGASHLMPGQSTTLTARIKDWQGNQLDVGGQSVDFSASGGSSSGTIGSVADGGHGAYTATFEASSAGSALTISGSIGESYQVDTTASLQVHKWRLYISGSAATVTVGQSVTLTATVKNYLDVQASTGGQTLYFSQGGGVSSGTIGTPVVDHGDGTYTAPFAATTFGTATMISASISQSYEVVQTASLTVTSVHLWVSASQAQVNPGGTSLITAQIKDAGGTNIYASTYTIGFESTGAGTSTGTFGPTTYLGLGVYQAVFTGSLAGSAITLSANSSSGYVVDHTDSLTVTPWHIEIAASKTTYVINETGTLTGRIKDWHGDYLATGGKAMTLALAIAGVGAIGSTTGGSDATGPFYRATFTAGSSGSTAVSASMPQDSTVTVVPTLTVGQAYIHLTVAGGLASTTINSGSNVVVRATVTDSDGTTVNGFSYGILFSTSGSGSTVAAVGGVTQVSAGVSEITYQGVVAGSALTVTATSSVAYTVSTTATITVVPAAAIDTSRSSLAVSAATVRSAQAVTLTATMKDAAGNLMPGLTGVSFAMTTGAGIGTGTLSAVTDIGSGQYTAVLTGVTPGVSPMNISAIYSGVSVAQTVGVTVNSGAPDRFTVSASGTTTFPATSCSSALQLTFKDTNNNATTLAADATFTVSGLGYAVLYSNSLCTTPIASTVISDGVSTASITVASGNSVSQSFYFKTFYPATNSLVFTAAGLTQTNSPFALTTTPMVSWQGASGVFDINTGSGSFYADSKWDGGFESVQGITLANIGGSPYLLVTDNTAHRVTKYSVDGGSSGTGALTLVGSLGRVHGPDNKGIPTGQASGASAAANYCTSIAASVGIDGAWCKGFVSLNGVADAQMNSPYTSTVMNIGGTDYLFVSDYTNHRILKYEASTGVFIGWTGRILTTPTSGPTGGTATQGTNCTDATKSAVGNTTTGWCKGGTAQTSGSGLVSGATFGGSVDGGNQFNGPEYITNDGTYLYISDFNNNRIVKLDPTTGLLVHWMGRIASTGAGLGGQNGTTTPSAITCLTYTASDGTSTMAMGQFTPSWCSGGSSYSAAMAHGSFTNGNLNPQVSAIYGIAFYKDAGYNWMLVVDFTNSRVSRYMCGTAVNGTVPNCAGTSSVSITNDANTATTTYYPGQFFGWTGLANTVKPNIATLPQALARTDLFNFTATAVTTPTNGWAYFGNSYATSGNPQGSLATPKAITIAPPLAGSPNTYTYAYVANYGAHRIERLSLTGATRGQFDGWTGRASSTPSGGAVGCASAASGQPSPGWCKGGNTTSGAVKGALFYPSEAVTDGTFLYVTDRDNFRLVTYNLATGLAIGTTGLRVNNQPSQWQATGLAVGAYPINSSSGATVFNRDSIFYNPEQILINGDYMYVSDNSLSRIKRYKWLDGSFQGWIGITYATTPTGGFGDNGACAGTYIGGYTPGWCSGGGATSTTNFGFYSPKGLATDGRDGYPHDNDNLYVADYSNHRIVRIRMSDGAFTGWIGYIATSPSEGEAGCAGAAAGTITPHWCLGGTSSSTATLGGYNGPAGLTGYWDDNNTPADTSDDKFYLIVGDTSNARMVRVDVTNPGAPSWVGRNNSASAPCGYAVGAMVMAWCASDGVGISSNTTSPTSYMNNGYLSNMNGMTVDSSIPSAPIIYVTTSTSAIGRIMRFNAKTGAYTGWIGKISGTGNHGCSSTPTSGSFTPGWCTGGTVTIGFGDGHMQGALSGLYTDGTYIWVSDSNHSRIQKFNAATGAVIGWKGKVMVTPTGGPSGATTGAAAVACKAASVGSITPDWCTNGDGQSTTPSRGGIEIDTTNMGAAFDYPKGLWVKGAYLYVVDSYNGRIVTIPK
jgi:hypothetical protein